MSPSFNCPLNTHTRENCDHTKICDLMCLNFNNLLIQYIIQKTCKWLGRLRGVIKVRGVGCCSSNRLSLGASKVRQNSQQHRRWCENTRNVTINNPAPDWVNTDTAVAVQAIFIRRPIQWTWLLKLLFSLSMDTTYYKLLFLVGSAPAVFWVVSVVQVMARFKSAPVIHYGTESDWLGSHTCN